MTAEQLEELRIKPAREYLAEEYEYLNRYPSYAELARSENGEFTMCSIKAIQRAQDDLARRVIAADKLVEAAKSILDNYGFTGDGNDAYREVETAHITSLDHAVTEYKATT